MVSSRQALDGVGRSKLMPPVPKNPVLVSQSGYRKAIVRHCTELLREIEGRFEASSGPRWESQLQSCEDLAGVGRLILTLQRRTTLHTTVDNAWLEELAQLSSAEIDERAIDLTRKVKHRISALCVHVPYPVDPVQLVGATVVRSGDGSADSRRGRVLEHDRTTGFRVLYADGDVEDLPTRELRQQLAKAQRLGGGRSATTGGNSYAEASADVVGHGHDHDRDEGGDAATSAAAAMAAADALATDETCVQTLYERVHERHRRATEAAAAAVAPVAPMAPPLSKTQAALGGQAASAVSPSAASTVMGASACASGRGGGRQGTRASDVLAPAPAPAPAAARPKGGGGGGRSGGDGKGNGTTSGANNSGNGSSAIARSTTAVPPAARKRPRSQLESHAEAAEGMAAATGGKAAAMTASADAEAEADDAAAATAATAAAVTAAAAAARPARAALPDSGLSLVELEAAAGAGPKKRLPRELRNLALPDREWHVAVPFFTTGSKTREQFSSSADMQAAAAAARDMHSRRVAEAEAAAEEAELRLDLEAEESRPEHRRGAGAS